MKNIITRSVSISVFCLIFITGTWLAKKTEVQYYISKEAKIRAEIAEQEGYYAQVDMVLFLDAKFYVSPLKLSEDRTIRTVFSRNAPFDIPTEQTTEVRAMCDGVSVNMRRREPIRIILDKGENLDVSVSYNADEWGVEKIEGRYNKCDLIVSKTFYMELPHGIKRTMAMKATSVIEW